MSIFIRHISLIRPIFRAAVLGRAGTARQLLLASGIGLISLISLIGAPQTASASVLHKVPNNLGLVGYWSFEDGKLTTATDFSGKGSVGTLTNMEEGDWTQGKVGKGLTFDGSDEYVSVADNSSLNLSTSFSVAGWVKLAAAGQDNAIFDSGTQANHWLIQIESTNNKIDFVERAIADNVSNTSLSAGTWYHVAVVKSGDGASNVTFYLNGQADGTASVGSVSAPSGNKTIGNWTESNAQTFNGSLDDIRIYNRALGATEIAALYDKTSQTVIKNTSKGLVAHWSFSEGAGTTTANATGQGNIGILTNSPTWTTGKFGNGLSFDGTDDFVAASSSSPLELTRALSLSAWIKLGDSTSTQYVVSKGTNDLANGQYGMLVSNTNIEFHMYSAGHRTANVSSAIAANTWYHVVGAWDGTTISLYIDGVLRGSSSFSGPMAAANTGEVQIGRMGKTAFLYQFQGLIDDVRIYNRGLSVGEVLNLYNSSGETTGILNSSQNTQLTSGLVGMWDFNGPRLTTTTATDASTSGNNGTLSGGPIPVAGVVGQALKFDGTDDYVDIGTGIGSTLNSSTWSIAGWVNLASQRTKEIAFCGSDHSRCVGYWLSGNKFYLAEEVYNLIAGFTIETNQWTHFVFTYDGTNARAYKNGVLADTQPYTFLATYSGAYSIGRTSQTGNITYMAGNLDDIRVYSRALSAAEVLQLYNQGK